MLTLGNKDISSIYRGSTEVVKVSVGTNVVYEIGGGGIQPCFEVVDAISAATGNYVDVYNNADSKWYKKNNLNQYEEYGVYEWVNALSAATYYVGKLVMLTTDNHEYQWTGSAWVDKGIIQGVYGNYELYDELEFKQTVSGQYYFDTGYYTTTGITYIKAEYNVVRHDKDFVLFSTFNNNGGTDMQYFGSITYIGGNWMVGSVEKSNNYLVQFYGNNGIDAEYSRTEKYLKVNGHTFYYSPIHNDENPNVTVKLFNHPSGTSNKQICNGDKFYSFDIKEGEQYAVSLRPALRITDNTAGIYDTVRNVFLLPNQSISYVVNNSAKVLPVEYDTKVAPANYVEYNTLEELELMECPWVGMYAIIGGDTLYQYTENGWEQKPLIVAASGLTSGTTDFVINSVPQMTAHVSNGEWKVYGNDIIGKTFTDFYEAFHTTEGHKITTIDYWGIDMSHLTRFRKMFGDSNDNQVIRINMQNCNFANATSFEEGFLNLRKLTYLNIANWNIQNVSSFYQFFAKIVSLDTLDFSGWHFTENNPNINMIWWSVSGPRTVIYRSGTTASYNSIPESTYYSFVLKTRVTTLDVSNFQPTEECSFTKLCTPSAVTALYLTGSYFTVPNHTAYGFESFTSWTNADSLAQLVSELPTVSNYDITLSDATYNALSQEQIATIEGKGWTLTYQ